MPWFKIDDGFYDHPKVLELDMAAIGLWAVAGSYCARHLTDGVISERQIRAIGGTRKQAEKLVAAGLWSRGDVSPSARGALADASPSVRRYVFNDWLEFQPSRDETTARRREDADRKRDARAAKRAQQQKRGNVQPDVHADIPPESDDAEGEASERSPLYPTRPDPTRPSFLVTNGGRGTSGDARETPPPGNLDPSNPRCLDHADVPAADPGPNCLGCKRVREWCESAPARAAADDLSARRGRRDAIDACGLCDDGGWLVGVEPVRKCSHLRPAAES